MRNKPKILVLGHQGMLGHMLVKYFLKENYTVQTTGKRYDPFSPEILFETIRSMKPNVVINAIGLIKQKTDEMESLLAINTAFPLLLRLSIPTNIMLIHPSTDCVFLGDRGNYHVEEKPDAVDPYGLSKSLGEKVSQYDSTIVVRCSIIGPEIKTSWGLFAWLMSQNDGDSVCGYINHLWNGITTLEWAKVAHEQINTKIGQRISTVIQPGTEQKLSKADVLRLIARIFEKDVQIRDHVHEQTIDRTLFPTHKRVPLSQQLYDMKLYYNS